MSTISNSVRALTDVPAKDLAAENETQRQSGLLRLFNTQLSRLENRVRHFPEMELVRRVLPVDSEDVVQETFMRLLAVESRGQSLRQMTDDELTGYVHVALENHVHDLGRKARSLPDHQSWDGSLEALDNGESLAQHDAKQRISERLREACLALSADERVILEMRLLDAEWSAIGDSLGIQPDAARKRFTRILEAISQKIHGGGG